MSGGDGEFELGVFDGAAARPLEEATTFGGME